MQAPTQRDSKKVLGPPPLPFTNLLPQTKGVHMGKQLWLLFMRFMVES